MNEKDQKNPYQNSLNLPQTSFSIRAQSAITEPAILKRWSDDSVYAQSLEKNKGNTPFILHDGPPYANGHIHLGTTLNKCLKDFVTKSKRMTGHYVPFVLGWDCHGLPIELKVTQQDGAHQSSGSVAERLDLKKKCRAYAKEWIDTQREEFKDIGVIADMDKPYITMDPSYEASILRGFAAFVEQGYIERKGKAVPWCSSCQTVLAGAEIEYHERKDPSCYILFPLDEEDTRKLFPFLYDGVRSLQEQAASLTRKNFPGHFGGAALQPTVRLRMSLLVWTTTPWTIPLNRAVAIHPSSVYAIVQGRSHDEAFIVAKDLVASICSQMNIEPVVLAEFDSVVLSGYQARHPLQDDRLVPIILEHSVSLTDGTACVHIAPGCGPEDYLMGVKHKLEVYSPISSAGTYTKGIEEEALIGMPVQDGQIWVMRKLAERNKLFFKTNIKHSYPHCWRCRNGLIFRATEQWFCNLQNHNLIKKAVHTTEEMDFIPAWGKNRLQSFLQNRSEWCISRQRQWGVPIPALLCTACQEAYLDADFIKAVAGHVEREGIEFWDTMNIPSLIKLGLLPENFSCTCGSTSFDLERDILDVWFDSGVSSYAVVVQDKRLSFPADLYLEGSDQHRGWFQSSLFCSMVINGSPYAKTTITHGFVVDEHKHKMSKSLGNVIAPQDIIKKYSRDIMRLWVASSDYAHDVVISETLLKNLAEVYKKIRNTCRFMLSNLYDFDFDRDHISHNELMALDQYIVMKIYRVREEILQSYAQFNFASVVQLINNFCTNDLSSVYLDIVKDRLYVEASDSIERRSAQTTLYLLLDHLTHLMAPILSFLAEEVSDYYLSSKSTSIHLRNFPSFDEKLVREVIQFEESFEALEALRSIVLKAIEEQRQQGSIKHSLEAHVTIAFDKEDANYKKLSHFIGYLENKEGLHRFLKDWFIVSEVTLLEEMPLTHHAWVAVTVQRASGAKCQRCWQWHAVYDERTLCNRCAKIIG